jgi:hypothetical protein
MKTLKFRKELAKLILEGKKDNTWRLFDEKDISVGDEVSLLEWESKEEFAKAKVTSVKEAKLGRLTDKDKEGHEKFSSDKEMYKTYSTYYRQKVDEDTLVKIIRFELL